MYKTDREVTLAVGPSGLYLRLLRPRRTLCSKCETIPATFFTEPEAVFDHSPTITDLKSSAASGCHLCTLLCRSLEEGFVSSFMDETLDGAHGNIEIAHGEKWFPGGNRWDMITPIHHYMGSSSGSVVGWGSHLRFKFAEEPGYDDFIDDSAASESSFFMLKEMIEECTENHIECRAIGDTPGFLPTRLLSVGTLTNPHLKIITTAESEISDDRYLTLSHCWGGMSEEDRLSMTTTSATLASRHAGIAEDTLSKTFQDFIYAARALDVPYLWIDSLCIIQESAEDWNREVAMMEKVYSHAFCTIAADASEDGNGGLFVPRNPLECQNCDFRILEDGPPGRNIVDEARVDLSEGLINIFPPMPAWDEIIEREHLSTRGWTFQERLLSPRIVHYTTKQIVWECRKWQKSEQMHRMGLSGPYPVVDSNRIFDERPWGLNTMDFKRWYALVCDYSRRNFTEEMDRLAALSGLAQEVRRRKGWHYVAGMWEEDLDVGLRWEINPHQMKTHHRPKAYRAPSWSWASVEGHISYHDPEVLPIDPKNPRHFPGAPKVLQVRIEPAAGDPFGQLRDGILTVHGAVKSALVGKNGDRYHLLEIGADSRGGSASIEFDAVEEVQEGNHFLLRMSIGRDPIIDAMALVPSSDGKYRRVGWVSGIRHNFFDDCEETTIVVI